MAHSPTAQAALEAVWAQMIELAEAGNDLVVLSQVNADASSAHRIASIAEDLATLAKCAHVLAREDVDAP